MAPELEKGAHAASPGSDLYSLGVVAYEILAKRLPPAPLSQLRADLPAELTTLINRCLDASPDAPPSAVTDVGQQPLQPNHDFVRFSAVREISACGILSH